MNLHENNKLFKEAVKFTAQQLNISDIYIEKDYWVTLALYTIFNDPIGKETVFKGGTALSKCYRMIERFSEDIDLVVLKSENDSSNKLTNKIKKVTKVVSKVLPEIQVEGLTRKMGMNRKTAHSYSKEFIGNYDQIRDVVIVEATWLGHHEPYVQKTVSSYIYDMLQNTGQEEIAKEYNLLPFNVLVLDVKRTLCEKIMSLVRFSYADNPIVDLQKKIRHTYDIHQILQNPEIKEFLESDDFEKLLLKVAKDDILSYKNDNDWLKHHPKEAIIFAETENTWKKLSGTYKDDFQKLVYGDFPDQSDILKTVQKISKRLEIIDWQID